MSSRVHLNDVFIFTSRLDACVQKNCFKVAIFVAATSREAQSVVFSAPSGRILKSVSPFFPLGLANRFEEYPKLRELIRLKDELIETVNSPPM